MSGWKNQQMEAAWITESPPGGQLPQRAGFPSANGDVIERETLQLQAPEVWDFVCYCSISKELKI